MWARRATISTVRNVVEINRRRGNPADPLRMPTGYSAHRAVLEAMLNEVLATELVCVLRYRRYFFISKSSQAEGVKPSFLQFAQVQQEQADRIAERIVQLGGSPQVDPSDLAARSQSRCAAGADLQDMVGEDLLFLRTAIESYDALVRYFETHDLTTARMLASILVIHEHHAEELAALMVGLTPPLHA
jgi:bacterioferritin